MPHYRWCHTPIILAGESCTIRVWDIENEPRFLFETEKGIECITDKISVVKKSVVMVPSWPIAADALVMTLDIDEENRAMKEGGKFRFEDDAKMRTVDEHWESTMLRAVRNMAVVILKVCTMRTRAAQNFWAYLPHSAYFIYNGHNLLGVSLF